MCFDAHAYIPISPILLILVFLYRWQHFSLLHSTPQWHYPSMLLCASWAGLWGSKWHRCLRALLFFFKDFVYLFLERGKEGERGETSMQETVIGCLSHVP